MAAAKVATITIPLLSSKEAAVKFKQNWITKSQPVETPKTEPKEDNLDDSLTSLNWLQNLRIMRIQHPTPPSSPTPLSIQNSIKSALQIHKGGNGVVKSSNSHKHSHSEIKISKVSSSLNHLHHNHHHHLHQSHLQLDQKTDYKTNSSIKPPYSYSTMIWMAMKESKKHKITLSSIYKWITENFKYYQVADPSWQNSIRHNLSLNKCFQKVPRKKDEPGKGGFWRIDPAHADELENGVFKKRRHASFRELPIKIKTEPESEDECPPFEDSKHHSRKQTMPKKRSASEHGGSHSSSKKVKVARSQSYKPPSLLDDSMPSSILKEDFSWNSIFESEIEIEGTRIKTEDILDGQESDTSDSFEMDTPPPSEHETNINDSVLDLSITGTRIPRPVWFEEQLKEIDLHPADVQLEDIFAAFDLPPSPAGSLTERQAHPWAETRNINLDESGTFGDLFDFGQLAEGAMPWQENPMPSP
nr:forkhead box protein J1-B-like [Lytechinus pictus]